jgi:aminoglycoside phosphotransferase (APT) family kinase protein
MSSGPAWQGEFVVDAPLAQALIQEQFPEFGEAPIVRVGEGWDHIVWRCRETVFRFPHQAESLKLARRSVTTLGELAHRLPLQIPVPTHIGRPGLRYPGHFVGYRWLRGCLPARVAITPQERFAAALPLAEFLRALHGLDATLARSWGIEAEGDKGSMAQRAEFAKKRVRQLAGTAWENLANRSLGAMGSVPAQAETKHNRVVHGDLHAGQVLLDEQHRLTAVIDWDELAIGDTAFDLVMVYSFLPQRARVGFWRAYGDKQAAKRARHLALSYGLAFLVQALETEDTALRDEAVFGLENALVGPEV